MRPAGKGWHGPFSELVVPVFETDRLVKYEGEIVAAREFDRLSDDIGQFPAFHIRVHGRDDFGVRRHAGSRHAHELALHGAYLSAD